MYEIETVLQQIEQNLGWVLLFTAIAWLTGFVQIVEGVRLGRRDRVPGVPIGMTVFLLAHDASFFLRYDHWFNTVGHWYFELFWVGMGGWGAGAAASSMSSRLGRKLELMSPMPLKKS